MSRKTFQALLIIVGFGILLAVLAPKIIDYINQPDVEDTIVGYTTGTELAVVDTVLEEGEVTLGEVVQNYQVILVSVEKGEFAGDAFEIEYGTRQIRNDMIMLEEGDRILINISTSPDGLRSAHFIDFYRRNSLILLFVIFTVVSVLISGWKGIRTPGGYWLGRGTGHRYIQASQADRDGYVGSGLCEHRQLLE